MVDTLDGGVCRGADAVVYSLVGSVASISRALLEGLDDFFTLDGKWVWVARLDGIKTLVGKTIATDNDGGKLCSYWFRGAQSR